MEKYGWRLILGSHILKAGLRCRSYSRVRRNYELCQWIAYAANQAFGILIHGPIVGELKFVLKHSNIHVWVIICPEGSLKHNMRSRVDEEKHSTYNARQHLV